MAGEEKRIRPLEEKDKPALLSMLTRCGAFTPQEIDVAVELIEIVLKDKEQRDYRVDCLVNGKDFPLGYICFGPVPMTQGTFDLYWIAVDPDSQRQGIGSMLVAFLDKEVRGMNGRMILADTSTIPQYEKTRSFYLSEGLLEVARISDYYHPGNDRVTFCKRMD